MHRKLINIVINPIRTHNRRFLNSNSWNNKIIMKSLKTLTKRNFSLQERKYTYCFGCGMQLQTTDPTQLGFTPENSLNSKSHICQRCYKVFQ